MSLSFKLKKKPMKRACSIGSGGTAADPKAGGRTVPDQGVMVTTVEALVALLSVLPVTGYRALVATTRKA